jgi:hypothetical protein
MTYLHDLDISLQCFYENTKGLLGEGRTDSLPTSIRNQLNLRINMSVPTPEVKRMMFPDTQKEFQPLSNDLKVKVWGFIQSGNEEVRSFFAPEIPKDFNIHEYMRKQIAKREVA